MTDLLLILLISLCLGLAWSQTCAYDFDLPTISQSKLSGYVDTFSFNSDGSFNNIKLTSSGSKNKASAFWTNGYY